MARPRSNGRARGKLGRALVLGLLLGGCALDTRLVVPELEVGKPEFQRALEGHTRASLVDGNSARILLNGDQIFPAMLQAIRSARTTITFANYAYEAGDIAGEMAEAFAERCRAGVGVSILLDATGS